MAEPFLGEIRLFGFGFAPRGWAFCNGQELSQYQHQALFALIGGTFGPSGQTSFCLPDLRGRVPQHPDSNQGLYAGQESVYLTTETIPAHTHKVMAYDGDASKPDPENHLLSRGEKQGEEICIYADPFNSMPIHTATISDTGKGRAHSNIQPYLTVNFCIALTGVYPQRS